MPRSRRPALILVVGALLCAAPAVAQDGMRRLTAEEEAEAAPPPQQMEITKQPQLLEFVEAPYPEAAKAEELTAAVGLIITIGADGAVTEVVLAGEPVGYGFDEAAIEAAKQFTFSPAHINGEPAAIRVPFTYRFAFVPDPEQDPQALEAAETARVVGRVREKGSKLPLAAVPVSVGTIAEAFTDANGRFVIESVPPGAYEIVATSPDHRRFRMPVELVAGEEVDLDMLLDRLRSSPFETIVRGEREQTSLTRRTLERGELRTVPGTFGDPLRAVQNLPGIARSPYVLGILLVRGSGPGDSAVMIDGHEVPLLYHFLGGPSVLPADMLDRIDFYPGNFSVRFGRALGGIVDVGTRRTTSKQWRGDAHFDLFDAGLYLEGPITDDISFSASARRSYIDGVVRGVVGILDPDDLALVLPRYYDYQARVDWRINRHHKLSFLAFGSDDDLEVIGEPGSNLAYDVTFGIGFHRYKLDWTATPTPEVEFTFSPVLGVDTTGFAVGDVEGKGEIDEVGIRFDLRVEPTEDLTLRTGLDSLNRFITYTGRTPLLTADYRTYPGSTPGERAAVELERDLAQLNGALYLEAEWAPFGGPVTVVGGVRTDQFDWGGEYQWFVDPRMTVRWALDEEETWVIKGGAGIFSQPPTEWRLDPDFGNPNLTPEWAEHYGLGVEHTADALTIDLQAFYIRRHDLSEATESLEGDSLVPSRFENSGDGRGYGIEVLIKHEVTRDFYGWLSYTLSRSEDRPTPDEPYAASLLDQTHNLIMVASYKMSPEWETGLRFRLVSGNLDTPVVGSTFDADQGEFVADEGEPFSVRQPAFNQLDIRVERTWTFDAWRLAAYLDLQNIYNAINPEGTRWDYRFRESAPLPGLTVLPSFGLRGSF